MSVIAPSPSELKAEYLSNNSVDPWVDVNSGPRKVMLAGHLPQALVIKGSEERYWQTGTEARFGEYCFSVKSPGNIEINRVIERFPRSRTIGTSLRNPQTIAVYTDVDTRVVGILDLRDHSLEHQYFGFAYKKTKEYHRINKGEFFEKDTPFLTSPSIKEGGGYGIGANLVFALMSLPGTSEDGIIISESARRKMSFDLIETRTESWGSNRFALNLFGNDEEYKIFKDVGERIRPDGLLMATRERDERLSITGMGKYDTRMIDMMYDQRLYTRAGDGIVEDIMVYHDNRSLPSGMDAQIMRYKELTDRFYRDILDEYTKQLRAHNNNMKITDEFHRLVLEACAMTDYDIGDVVQKLYHKAPIDDWRVEFKIKYTITPTIGNKATGFAGDKGVVCTVIPDDDMPVNDFGVRAEVIMSPESPFNRQNFGGIYEPYFNQITREHLFHMRETLNLGPDTEPTVKQVEEDIKSQPETYAKVWKDLTRLYEILSPVMYENYTSPDFEDNHFRATHLSWLLRYPCIHILSPTDRMTPWRQAVKLCREEFPPRISPVTYRGVNGEMIRTKKPVELGHKAFMLLEKISDDWIAVSTAKVQHLQVLGQVTSSDKYANPAKSQAVKAISEAELRIILSYCGGQVAADLLDRNNSLATHKEYAYSILSADQPTNIERGVDRKIVPLGNNRALQLFKHILTCNGYMFVWKKYADPDLKYRDTYIDPERAVSFASKVSKAAKRATRAVRTGMMKAYSTIRNLIGKEG